MYNTIGEQSRLYAFNGIGTHFKKDQTNSLILKAPQWKIEVLLVSRRVLPQHWVLARCKLRIALYCIGWLVYLMLVNGVMTEEGQFTVSGV